MKRFKKSLILLLVVVSLTGCTTYLKDKDGKNIVNPTTGQNLTENILCKPTDEETIKIYEENNIDLSKLPSCVCKEEETTDGEEVKCNEFKITSGGDEGLWAGVFVKPLAWLILFFGDLTKNYGLGLIIVSLLIRLAAYPVTKKTAMQAENMKKIQPEMSKIEKKYADKDQNDKDVMMMKSQEMMAIYKKYNVNPISGCLMSFLQLPLFIAFLEAINRVPAIFEEKLLFFHLGTSPSVGISNGNYLYLIIIALVAVSTYFSFKNNSTSNSDDAAAKQTKFMMNGFLVMIVVMSIFMTSALGIYWVTSNTFTIIQNYIVRRKVK